jgi:hypothetical protein
LGGADFQTIHSKGEEHLLYRCDREADRPQLSASHAPDMRIRRRKSGATAGFFVAMTGFRQLRRLAAASEAICLRHD